MHLMSGACIEADFCRFGSLYRSARIDGRRLIGKVGTRNREISLRLLTPTVKVDEPPNYALEKQ
jgi:hypothetical protein